MVVECDEWWLPDVVVVVVIVIVIVCEGVCRTRGEGRIQNINLESIRP